MFYRSTKKIHYLVLFASAAVVAFGSPSWAQERSIPGAPHLLPQDTLGYIRLDNVDDLREEMAKSSMGKMLNDPEMKPFATDIYRTADELFGLISEQLGVTLDELLSIPSGQVSAALMPGNVSDQQADAIAKQGEEEDDSPEAIRRRIAQKRRQQFSLAGMFMIDAGDNVDKLMILVKRLERQLLETGYVRRSEKIKDVELVKLLPPRQGPPEIEYFEKDKTIILGIGHKTAANALDQWLDQSEEPTLADSSDFAAVMSRCVGAEETRPQMTFYFDPYHFVERVIKSNGGAAAFAWPMIEELGIGKIRGIGGSAFRGGDEFEGIAHFHMLIDPPRDGFFGVLRPESGDSTPPAWVPSDVTSYVSIYWDFETTYDNFDKILAKFQGEGPMKRFVEEPMKRDMGIEMREELLENFTGRYITCAWIEPPIKLNSQSGLHALELKDPLVAKQVIAKLRDRSPNEIKVETIAGKVIYTSRAGGRNFPEGLRRPEPCAVLLDNWFVFSDSREFLTRVIQANGGAIPQLVDVPEYNLIVSELGGKLSGEKPFMVSFMRPSEYFRQLYELVQSDNTKRFVRQAGDRNEVAKKISAMLQRNQLPKWEKFERYFAPSGSFAYDEPSGIHMGTFTLRGEE